jgi:hypothetical protein
MCFNLYKNILYSKLLLIALKWFLLMNMVSTNIWKIMCNLWQEGTAEETAYLMVTG